jgi:hypothetical protein
MDENYPNMFAVGDIADTGAQKAARPGAAQAAVVAKNIQAMIEGKVPSDTFVKGPGAIHLTLGMVCKLYGYNKTCGTMLTQHTSNIMLFSETRTLLKVTRNHGSTKSLSKFSFLCFSFLLRFDGTDRKPSGQEDMNVEAMWQRLGVTVDNPRQYHL